jgi:hypothetical protein
MANQVISTVAAALVMVAARVSAQPPDASRGMTRTASNQQLPYVKPGKEDALSFTAGWPKISQCATALLVSKYGLPDDISSRVLAWNGKGLWRKTIVFRTGTQHGFFQDPDDILRQSIDYDVPRRTAADLAKMDIGVVVDRHFSGLTATSDSEEANILAINLAVDVIKEARTPGEARDFYTRERALAAAGKSSSYTTGFLFPRP